MASGLRLTRAGNGWAALATLLAAGSVVGWWLPAPVIDWQPGLASTEPWRAFSAAFVHWSELHLLANVGAAAAVGAYGWAGGVPLRATLAWFVAWPLTQATLLLRPELAHYGGLSGVLHAGVAVVSAWLVVDGHGRQRAIAAVVGTGLLVKVLLERPWGPALQSSADWDIAVAPWAHAGGAAAGLLCGALALAARRLPRSAAPESRR